MFSQGSITAWRPTSLVFLHCGHGLLTWNTAPFFCLALLLLSSVHYCRRLRRRTQKCHPCPVLPMSGVECASLLIHLSRNRMGYLGVDCSICCRGQSSLDPGSGRAVFRVFALANAYPTGTPHSIGVLRRRTCFRMHRPGQSTLRCW